MSIRLVMGGTFDPIHHGHLELADAVRRAVGVGTLWLMPTAVPPHKPQGSITSAEHRIAMVWAAMADYPALAVSTVETGSTISYTIDTLRRLETARPTSRPVFVLGMDSVVQLPGWDRWQELIEEFDLIALARPDLTDDEVAINSKLHPDIAQRLQPTMAVEGAKDWILEQQLGRGGRIFALSLPPIPVSSREVRRRVSEGEPIDDLVPTGVSRYIRDHRLYSERQGVES
jgi:nicotinate-nucleotide adenylyltransferase